jgi:hypothetical protein
VCVFRIKGAIYVLISKNRSCMVQAKATRLATVSGSGPTRATTSTMAWGASA